MSAIVVGVDRSEQARAAAKRAAELASALGVPLHVVSAVKSNVTHVAGLSSDQVVVDDYSVAHEVLAELAWEFRDLATVTTAVMPNDPATALCDEATRLAASMIVVGNRRVQGASRVLGSIAGAVTKQAPCDVLIVHTYG